ncbi:MAG: hypothetical protein ABFC96_08465 [Thermoguttaceae bacterium]
MTPELLSLDEAAVYLGCRPKTLRKIIDRSRLRLKGIPVNGPTIQFFQSRARGAILFRQSWLDAYIEAGTHRPEAAPMRTKVAKPRTQRAMPAAPTSASAFGFFYLPDD